MLLCRKFRYIVMFIAAFSLFLFPVQSDAKTKSKTKKAKTKSTVSQSVGSPVIGGKYAALVIEADTGRILLEENARALRHPASLTKMMTLYLSFQAIENGVIRLDTPLRVSANAANQSPSKLGLRAGQTVNAYDAIMGLVTESANDAAVVLAENLAGSTENFAELMVSQARALGMNSSVFRNPNGLPDPRQVTTAQDMAILGHALIYHYPGFYPYFGRESFRYNGRVYNNHNHLMKRYEGMDGIKTGYIRASGFNLVASVVRGERRLIGVIFGGQSAKSRDNHLANLLDDAFAKAERGQSVQNATIPLPTKTATAFGIKARRQTQVAAKTEKQEQLETALVAPAMTAPVTTTAPSGGGGWGIQVGAYSEISAAQQSLAAMSNAMAPILGQAEPSLQKITMTDGSSIFRARFMGLDEKTARAACSYMVKHGQGCLVVTGL